MSTQSAERRSSLAVSLSYISAEAKSERARLILEHMPQVKLIAGRIVRQLPLSVSFDDLVSAGVVGLIAAIDGYDCTREVRLSTYAEHRIRGAILDSLRAIDCASRGQRRRSNLIQRSIASLEKERGQAPSEDEIANHLGISLRKYRDWLLEARGLTVISLENSDPEDEHQSLLRYLSDSGENCPSRIVERAEIERCLAEAISRIPRIEQTLLSLYYKEGLTFVEIGKILGIRGPRLSQLKSQAILRLRSLMASSLRTHGDCAATLQDLTASAAAT